MAKAVLQETVCGCVRTVVFSRKENCMSQPSFQDAKREQNGILPRPNVRPAVDGLTFASVHPLGPSNLVGASGMLTAGAAYACSGSNNLFSSRSESLSAA
jgi:hypothetical protein